MKYFIVDVFTTENFKGNPAGVCVLDSWIPSELMQKIAFENGLPETAFLVKKCASGYELKWFTPEEEMDLCGHATLASAFVVYNYLEKAAEGLEFDTQSGKLYVAKKADRYVMDLPSRMPFPVEIPLRLEEAISADVLECHNSRDLLCVLKDEKTVSELKVDLAKLKSIGKYTNFIFTAEGTSCDFVSRFFTSYASIPEDPVTGSAHCSLIPFWSKRLEKDSFVAKQLSFRGGILYCENAQNRVTISGNAKIYLIGEIFI